MKKNNISTSCSAQNVNANMNCTHGENNEVQIDFRFNEYGSMPEKPRQTEFAASQRATIDGRPITSEDRYDLTGQRLTEKRVWDNIFTDEYYAELDAAALYFASVVTKAKEMKEEFNN